MENNIKLCKMTCRIEFSTGPGTRDNSGECNSTLDKEGLNDLLLPSQLGSIKPRISVFCWWN